MICFEYWFCTAAYRSLSSESIKIILFKMSHLRLWLRLRHNYSFGLVETLAAQDFQSSCTCACGATFMTCAAHLWLQVRFGIRIYN